ncbi:hypothetical protein IF1G_06576 [Cordyceps javanica]|uniref:Uncharacterized protein n=1 Tax=Cordyceps javanica TaxID=43265 RepID=A0A545VXM3_9HYPO|nr:hypothetical protein IF1G_06576 [Cordyceps javanica]TQW06435.1 hypothetical protein IF2G_05857 [Cordyceps javanica]
MESTNPQRLPVPGSENQPPAYSSPNSRPRTRRANPRRNYLRSNETNSRSSQSDWRSGPKQEPRPDSGDKKAEPATEQPSADPCRQAEECGGTSDDGKTHQPDTAPQSVVADGCGRPCPPHEGPKHSYIAPNGIVIANGSRRPFDARMGLQVSSNKEAGAKK